MMRSFSDSLLGITGRVSSGMKETMPMNAHGLAGIKGL